jgi:NifU-like protein involved in Fe-S cluster formation
MGDGAIGRTAGEMRAAHAALAAWLKDDGPLPAVLQGQFPRLELFAPARAHPARHASIGLAFDAAAAAAEQAGHSAMAG